jgi:uncharacterized protein (TIGR02466 family)
MGVRELFPTRLYEGQVDVAELAASVRALAAEDRAGQRWCREHGYRGYTSYASLNDLPLRDPAFADLVRALDKHVAAFAKASGFRLAKRLKLDSLWVNILKPGAAHSGHIHPHSVVSGTVYVETPPGCGAIRFEDPRLPLMMAAPLGDDPRFVSVAPAPGMVLLWESWLRHEVLAGSAKAERISVSFNYA